MKALLFIAAMAWASSTVNAQNGFYLSPSVGVGATNVKQNYTYNDPTGNSITRSSLINYNAKIGIGYKYKNWRFQTGLQYLQTGYELNNLLFSSDFDPAQPVTTGTGTYQIRYKHLGIPLQVGYVIQPQKKFSLVPFIGLLTTYNIDAKSNIEMGNAITNTSWSRKDFDNRYNRMSVWGTAALYGQFNLNNNISLFAGPSLQYMISNFDKSPGIGSRTSSQRNYSINIDFGINIGL